MSICITVGHGRTTSGAYDPGAVNGDWHEHKIAREIAKYAADYYNKNYAEHCDLINYDSDIFLSERIRLVNSEGYDFVAEVHINAGGGSGSEVYHSVHSDSKTAAAISAGIAEEFGIPNLGAKVKETSSGSDYFAIIRKTKMQAVLIECLFIDRPSDLELVKTVSGRRRMGETIAKSIANARGISRRKEVAGDNSGESLYIVQAGSFTKKNNAEYLARKLKAEGIDAFVMRNQVV